MAAICYHAAFSKPLPLIPIDGNLLSRSRDDCLALLDSFLFGTSDHIYVYVLLYRILRGVRVLGSPFLYVMRTPDNNISVHGNDLSGERGEITSPLFPHMYDIESGSEEVR